VLRELRADGTTIVVVEQSFNVAATIAERAVFMDKGRVEFDGPVDELLRRPDLLRAIFMGGAASGGRVGRRRVQAEETETVLAIDDVSLFYGGVQSLDSVSLALTGGEVVGVIGPNGAGKTSLFDVVSGYAQPSSGAVVLAGQDVTKLSPSARARLGLGRSFQNARLFPALTVRETIAVALEKRAPKNPLAAALWLPASRKRERRLQERVDGYIELLSLGVHADKFIRELSTGSRRAVEVACVLAAEPSVLLLDEPSSGLAQAEIEALGPTLSRIPRETGCALLVIEHDLPLITQISDRLVAMELGQVLVEGPPAAVTSDPRVVQTYLAASDEIINRSGSRIGEVLSALVDEPAEFRSTV
jgi:branched-chain amino acid transport system ATP-binding protein